MSAFYGGTALRILYGLDRFSEDLDFSLLSPIRGFDIDKYSLTLEKELRAFGFDVRVKKRNKAAITPVQSAFLKANTFNELLLISTDESIVQAVPRGQVLKIELEVDTDPPPGFSTESKYLLQPIPFAVRTGKGGRGNSRLINASLIFEADEDRSYFLVRFFVPPKTMRSVDFTQATPQVEKFLSDFEIPGVRIM
jgi:hypothetical protein